MSDGKAVQKGSVLSNIEPSAEGAGSSVTSPVPLRSATPEEKLDPERKESFDQTPSNKDNEPEAKKRKRSQRACIRCRGQKLKCDGVFPCARCLKLKLVCKEPSEASSGTPTSSKVSSDERDAKAMFSGPSSRPPSQASNHLHPAGLPAPALSSAHFVIPPAPESIRADRSRSIGSYNAHFSFQPSAEPSQLSPDRFAHSLPDAVRRIESLERTVSRLVDKVEGPSSSLHLRLTDAAAATSRNSSTRVQPIAGRADRKRPRAASPDDSDAEVDELAQDGQSEASIPHQSLPQPAPRDHSTLVASSSIRPSFPAASTATQNPVEAGAVDVDTAQALLNIFFTYCHVFAPFLDLDDNQDFPSLASTEPFLLSVLLCIASIYKDPQAQTDSNARHDSHSRLALHVQNRLGLKLCEPTPSLGTVQALLLIAYWPQAFPGLPDEKTLATFASNLLQSVAIQDQLNVGTAESKPYSVAGRISIIWTSLRAFEALSAFDSGRAMDLTDQDLAFSKAPRFVRSSIPTPYLVRALPLLKEIQIWLSELSLGPALPTVEAVKPVARSNFNHDWDRFKYLQSQLFDIEKRWHASETDCSRLERIVGLVDRWTLQIYLAIIALKAVDVAHVSKNQAIDRSANHDPRFDEEASRFATAYRREIRQSCQVLMDIFTDPEISGALLYAPGYHLRRFSQAAVASACLLDFHDAELARSSQELLYLCTKRLDQIQDASHTPFSASLLTHVKSSYERSVGSSVKNVGDNSSSEASSTAKISNKRRWTGGDVFALFFGIGQLINVPA